MSTGVACPKCGDERSACVDVRPGRKISGFRSIRRRRTCFACAHPFTTYEVCAEALEQFDPVVAAMTGGAGSRLVDAMAHATGALLTLSATIYPPGTAGGSASEPSIPNAPARPAGRDTHDKGQGACAGSHSTRGAAR